MLHNYSARGWGVIALVIAITSALSATASMDWWGTKEWIQTEINDHEMKGQIMDTINQSTNETLIKNIQNELDKYEFTHVYEENIFDCTDTSQLTWKILTNDGYDTKLITNVHNKTGPQIGHMYVAVKEPNENKYVIIETTYLDMEAPTPIGRVIKQDPSYPYTRGWVINNTDELWFKITNIVYKSSVTNTNLNQSLTTFVATR